MGNPTEDTTITNIYSPKNRDPKCTKRKLKELKREVDHSTIIIGDFNNSLSITSRTTRQMINKSIEDLNNTVS